MAKRVTQKSIELSEGVLAEKLSLTRVYQSVEALENILNATGELTEMETTLLNEVRNDLLQNTEAWNEEELKMKFISMMMFLVRFQNPIREYYDREISADIENVFVKTKADMLLAKGIKEVIQTPYFFLHEYKREKKYSGDPIGQMLGGMLVAQAKNNNDKPTYGCYVQGRFWFFAVLINKEYVISQSFDATNEKIAKQILLILKRLKHIILTELVG